MPCRAASVALTATAARAGDGMTSKQLEYMERMWRDGLPSKQIARALGVTDSCVRQWASRDRIRFPYRNRSQFERRREIWVARLLAGRTTLEQAAHACDVTVQVVQQWLEEAQLCGDA